MDAISMALGNCHGRLPITLNRRHGNSIITCKWLVIRITFIILMRFVTYADAARKASRR